MFQSPRKAGRASLRRSLLLTRHFHIHVEANLDTTYSVKVHKLLICFTNNGVYCLHIDTCVFLRLLPRVLSFFFFLFSFKSLSSLFTHIETNQSESVAKTGVPGEKPPDTPASRTWLVPHVNSAPCEARTNSGEMIE